MVSGRYGLLVRWIPVSIAIVPLPIPPCIPEYIALEGEVPGGYPDSGGTALALGYPYTGVHGYPVSHPCTWGELPFTPEYPRYPMVPLTGYPPLGQSPVPSPGVHGSLPPSPGTPHCTGLVLGIYLGVDVQPCGVPWYPVPGSYMYIPHTCPWYPTP